MKLYTWDSHGFETAYSKYYYSINRAAENVAEQATLHACGKARCVCAYTDEIITYSKKFFDQNPVFKIRAEKIVNKLNIPIGSQIFVGGCAFGYLMEELQKLGMTVYGCDDSQYIQMKKNKEATLAIRDIDLTDTNFKSLVKQRTRLEYFDYVISEDVLTSYDDTSVNTILTNMESILEPSLSKNNIVHLVHLNCNPPFNNKSMNQWKTINPNHTWLDEYGND